MACRIWGMGVGHENGEWANGVSGWSMGDGIWEMDIGYVAAYGVDYGYPKGMWNMGYGYYGYAMGIWNMGYGYLA